MDGLHDIWIYSVFYEYNNVVHERPVIQAIGLITTDPSLTASVNETDVSFHLYSEEGAVQLQTRTGSVVLVSFSWSHSRLWEHGTGYATVKLECVLTSADTPPTHVSFSWPHNDTLTHRFTVEYPDTAARRHISVCYSVLYGGFNNASQLQQNVEYNRLMGAEHVFLYKQNVGPEVEDLLSYYSRQGFLTALPLPLSKQVRDSFYFGQHLAILDCHARNRNSSDWVALIDPDEYIMPRKHSSWTELLEYLDDESENSIRPTYAFQHTYYTRYQNASDWDFVKKTLHLSADDVAFIKQNHVQLFLEMNQLDPYSMNMGRFARRKSIFQPDLVILPGTHTPVKTVHESGRRTLGREHGTLAHHRHSMHAGKFNFYPQPYRDYLDLLKQAHGNFTLFQGEYGRGDRIGDDSWRKAAPTSMLPRNVQLARKVLERDVQKAREEGHDAWIVYPARLVVDGEIVKIMNPKSISEILTTLCSIQSEYCALVNQSETIS